MNVSKNILAILPLLIFFIGTSSCGAKDSMFTARAGNAVIELFTSEGCSSCPKADRTVEELQQQFGDTVLVLCYHVDYWNYLGWKDMFSAPGNTRRQHYYNEDILKVNSSYTPQAVINGRQECVGSDKQKLLTAIRNTPFNETKSKLAARLTGNVISVSLHADRDKTAVIYLVQKQATTQVRNGENSGKTLHHINIVRQFVPLPPAFNNTSFTLPYGEKKEDYFVAALVQDRASGTILDWTTSDIK